MTSPKHPATGVPFDPVDLNVIGNVGQSPPVNDEVRALIKRAFMEVTGEDVSEKATATIHVTLKIARVGGSNVRVMHDVKYSAPKKSRAGMLAHFDPVSGEVVTQEHRQMEFDGAKVVAISSKEGKQS